MQTVVLSQSMTSNNHRFPYQITMSHSIQREQGTKRISPSWWRGRRQLDVHASAQRHREHTCSRGGHWPMSKVKMVVVIMTMMVVFIAIVTWPGVVGRCLMQKGLPWTSVTTTRSASPVLSAPGSARESAIVETILKILFPDAGCRERHRNAGPTPCLPILLFQTARTSGRRSHQGIILNWSGLFLLQVAVLDIESSQRTDRIVPTDGSGCPK